jgi:hypothetical protein
MRKQLQNLEQKYRFNNPQKIKFQVKTGTAVTYLLPGHHKSTFFFPDFL